MQQINKFWGYHTWCIKLTFHEMINRPTPRIRSKSGSGTSPCCCLAWFLCQLTTVQIEFVELVSEINQSDWGMSFKIYMSKISLIDGPTSVTNSLKIRIRDKFVLLLHKVRLSVNIWYTHRERSLYPQTWFIPLIHSINGFYTFDINIYRYIRRGNNDKDLIMIRISSRSLTVNV